VAAQHQGVQVPSDFAAALAVKSGNIKIMHQDIFIALAVYALP